MHNFVKLLAIHEPSRWDKQYNPAINVFSRRDLCKIYGVTAKEAFNYVGISLTVVSGEMLVRVVRRLTLEEVREQIKGFEKECDMTFDEFEELFLKKKLNSRMVGTYFDWAGLVHAYRGYVETGELDYVVEELRELSPSETALLTPKRLELLYSLASLRTDSINDLAQKTRRNVKNVYQDLQALKSLGFVTFKKRGKRNIVPETLVEEITLLIR